MVAFVEVLDSPAVTGNMALEAPFISQNIFKQSLGTAAGLTVSTVVSAHNGLNLSLCNKRLECGKVSLCHILLGCYGIELVTDVFGTGVNSEVLRTCGCF